MGLDGVRSYLFHLASCVAIAFKHEAGSLMASTCLSVEIKSAATFGWRLNVKKDMVGTNRQCHQAG